MSSVSASVWRWLCQRAVLPFVGCLHNAQSESSALWVLVLAAIVAIRLFVANGVERSNHIARIQSAQALRGEGLFICHNGLGYYAWLRSLLIDGDLSFDNEFDAHALPNDYVPPPAYRTENNRRANQWSVGPACVWATTVVPLHFLLKALPESSPEWVPDGYSFPYQVAVGVTTLVTAVIGLFALYAMCRMFARPPRAAMAATAMWLGTTVVYYGAIEVSSAHGIGATAMAVFVWYWLRTYGTINQWRWLCLGLLAGIVALMRWQLATFVVLPIGEAVCCGIRAWGSGDAVRCRQVIQGMGLVLVGMVLAFLPQMCAWRLVYGSYLVCPIQGVHYHWAAPSLWQLLFSRDNGLFCWTPLTLVASIASLSVCRKRRGAGGLHDSQGVPDCMLILFISFLLQAYAISVILGVGPFSKATGLLTGVHLAHSYGFRFLTESLVTLAPSLALVLEKANPSRFRILCCLSFLLVATNLELIEQFQRGFRSRLSLVALLDNAMERLRTEPVSVATLMMLPATICLIGCLTVDAGNGCRNGRLN